MKIIVRAAAIATLALPGLASAGNYCGNLENHYGPYDYRTEKNKLAIVDHAHFTEQIEAGIRGNTADDVGPDLDYTLRASPNHHRALAALARIAIRDKIVQLRGTKWPVECYFLRAEQFAADDAVVWATYGSYLFGVGKYDKALTEYKHAIALEPESPMINYNIGLAYIKKNRWTDKVQ
jgi:tetratricopeptide (TPR) repeat protein